MNNWNNLTVILYDLPGHDCEEVGARIGLTIRRLMGISIDDVIEDWYPPYLSPTKQW